MHHERRSRYLRLTLGLAIAAILATGCKEDQGNPEQYGVAAATPDKVEFGVTLIGTPNWRPVTVQAFAPDDLIVEAITIEGDDAALFSVEAVDSVIPVPLPSGKTLSLKVTFSPTEVGERTATVRVRFGGDGPGYHVLGGGCADDPTWDEDAPKLQPADLLIELRGVGAQSPENTVCCPDTDDDGYAVAGPNCRLCGEPPKTEPGPCDTDANRHPEIADPCDGVDDDCDGTTDEDYQPTATTCGQGECANNGLTACVDGGIVDSCEPLTPPATVDDSCDDRDNDCDGATDEEFEGGATTCGTGVCAADGVLQCVNGDIVDTCEPGAATGEVDVCNATDDDCDGLTDEDFVGVDTTCGTGVCAREGETVCNDGLEEDTCPVVTPTVAVDDCDGLDNDCDGLTDEDFVGGETTCGDGACIGVGELLCQGGVVIDTCVADEPTPGIVDECNFIDDDCDGQTDEDFIGEPTTCGTGECENTGETICQNGAVVDTCAPLAPLTQTDDCDNLDNDCNGLTDEDFQVQATTCGIGDCLGQGQLLCQGGEVVDTCVPPEPDPEIVDGCNGVDDNCDGQTDEDFVSEPTSCGEANCASEGETQCVDGDVVDTCVPLASIPDVVDGCNAIDDDCDGQTDEDFEGQPTTCGGVGDCAGAGELLCVDGALVDTCEPPAGVAPRDIPCDGVDNDCDGFTDEDLPLAGGETGCEPTVPVLWDGTAAPQVSEDCFGFTTSGLETAPVVAVFGEPASAVGPGMEIRDEAMWVRTLPIGVQLWYEIEFAYPVPEQTVAAQVTVTLEDYYGDEASPGAALLVSNGNHVVWLNVVRHGIQVYAGEGVDQVPLGFVEALVQTSPHTVRLILLGDRHVRVVIDGKTSVTFEDALVGAPADPDAQARLRFGDWSTTAGAVIGWDELALFDLPTEQLDEDADGANVCDGDCDDSDAARSPKFVDDVCTTVDEDCRADTGPTPDGEPGLIGGPVVDGCADAIPSLWDGEALPDTTAGCGGFTDETIGDAPAAIVEAGALRIDSGDDPTFTAFWSVDWPDATAPAGAWLVARARVHVISYTGASDEPGNALFVANGANRVWLNITADRVALLGGAGNLLAEAAIDATAAFRDYWLVVAPNGDIHGMVDGSAILSLTGGAALADADTALAAGFGDASALGGAVAHWDDFGFFALENADLVDLDGDGVTTCAGDCDDTDPTVFPGQGENPADGIDHNCDGDPGKKPYCRTMECVGPTPDPDPVPGSGGCYRVFEYPDGWDGEPEVINMGVSGGTVGDVDGDGIEDIGFNHDDEAFLRFGQPETVGLGMVPDDPFTFDPVGVDVSFGSPLEPISQLGLAGVAGNDLNGDGLADVILGTRFALDTNDDRVGRVYVFFGRESWNETYDASAEANIVIEKSALDGWTASSVVAVRDINGDGIAEIGIKTKDSIRINARFYIFFGRPEWNTSTRVTLTNDDADLRYIDPIATYFVTGVGDAVHVAGIGDFDGDGFGDLALATPGRNAGDGAIFLVFGGTGDGYWPTDAANLTQMPNVLQIARPAAPEQTVIGAALAQGGDLNGDGLSDLVFTGRHNMYVVLGRPRATLLDQLGAPDLSDPGLIYDPVANGDYTFHDAEDTFPFDLAYSGDVDGDGYDDVLISTGENGGPMADLTNVSYLLYGAPELSWPLAAEIRDVYDACFHHGQSLVSAHVGRGGDFNADGRAEMVFSAPLRKEVRVLYGDWY